MTVRLANQCVFVESLKKTGDILGLSTALPPLSSRAGIAADIDGAANFILSRDGLTE
jgi:hypothetical protein